MATFGSGGDRGDSGGRSRPGPGSGDNGIGRGGCSGTGVCRTVLLQRFHEGRAVRAVLGEVLTADVGLAGGDEQQTSDWYRRVIHCPAIVAWHDDAGVTAGVSESGQ